MLRAFLDIFRGHKPEPAPLDAAKQAEADRMRWCANEAVKWPLSVQDVREVLSMAKDEPLRALLLLDFYGQQLGRGEGCAWVAMRQLAWMLRQKDKQEAQARP